MRRYRQHIRIVIFILIAVAGGYILQNTTPQKVEHSTYVKRFEKVFSYRQKELKKAVDQLSGVAGVKQGSDVLESAIEFTRDSYADRGISLFIYEGSRLSFWSDNDVPAPDNPAWFKGEPRVVRLDNGWYQHDMVTHDNRTVVGLALIKNKYPYQNQYLSNSFNHIYQIPEKCDISEKPVEGGFDVTDKEGKYICSLIFPEDLVVFLTVDYLSVWAYVIAGVMFLILLYRVFRPFSRTYGSITAFALLLVVLIGVRWIIMKLHFPANIFRLPIFDPHHYAHSAWNASMGDLIINVVLIFFLSWFFYKKFNLQINRSKRWNSWLLALGAYFAIFFYSELVVHLFRGLIIDSNISFDFNRLFSINLLSITGILIIAVLLISLFLVMDKLVRMVLQRLDLRITLKLFAISAILYVLICHIRGIVDLAIVMWTFPVILLMLYKRRRRALAYPFSVMIMLLLTFSMFSGYLLYKYNTNKEHAVRQLFASRIAVMHDPVAEYLFKNLMKPIAEDDSLKILVKQENMPAAEDLLRERYFLGFWDKYEIMVTICGQKDTLLIQPENKEEICFTFFDKMMKARGTRIFDEFYLIEGDHGRLSYLADLEPVPGRKMYLEFYSRYVQDKLGYPELLLDKKPDEKDRNINYSFAKYRQGELVAQTGDYNYRVTPKKYIEMLLDEGSFFSLFGYNHFAYQPDKDSLIIVSKTEAGILGFVTPFSYLFCIFSIIVLLITGFRRLYIGKIHLTFQDRIQVSIIAILVISLIFIGLGTTYYIIEQYKTKNYSTISEKIKSVQIEVEHKLGDRQVLDESIHDFMQQILYKFSNVFFTDINLYDTQGSLLATSRPKVFEEGLISSRIDPKAYLEMAVNNKTEFIHNENIGEMNYLSAYVPFRNTQGELLAYLNLPYFAKQSVLRQEISTFLVTLINIYVLLIAMTILSALIISGRLTYPLRLIQEKLAKVSLGKTNEQINWQSEDEIGQLIAQYNRMVAELEKSADLLARSERESAWREMAKQVAHEIKNPLTPMKLSVQHLQRAWQDQAPDWDKKLNRISQTLIEQIDTLSAIATEFSNFAKMPRAKREKLDVSAVLDNTLQLYSDSKNISINFEPATQPVIVEADKDQLTRVFNNLIKNALQAIPENRDGRIDVRIEPKPDEVLIMISDNGTGIPEEQREQIFSPSFTTKSGGMGLGLAMVKSIVENGMGKIWFETETEVGTTFYIMLPRLSKADDH